MNMEQLVEWELAGETEVLGENLSQCHFLHQKFHITWPGIEPGPPWWDSLFTDFKCKMISMLLFFSNFNTFKNACRIFGFIWESIISYKSKGSQSHIPICLTWQFDEIMVQLWMITVFWDVTPCSLNDVLLVFRCTLPENGGSTFLQNICKHLPNRMNITSQKIMIFMVTTVIASNLTCFC
jgi:hypothetical protein